MKVQNYFLFWFALSGILVFNSCSKDSIKEEIFQKENTDDLQRKSGKIPYASKEDLQRFSSNTRIVDYNLSREMALFDLKDFRKDVYQGKEDLKLSEMPVIIYDYDNNPKFYEFIVLSSDGKEIGTITSFAKKEVPGFTAYVLPFVRNYNDKNATKYSGVYPYSSEEEKDSFSTAKRTLSEEELRIKQEAQEFWEDMDNPKQNDAQLSALVRAWSEEYIIPEFNNDALLRTRWSGACAPAALAWLYRTYYANYKGVFYPLHGGFNGELNFGIDPNNNGVSVYARGTSPLYKDLAEKCRVGYGMDPFKDATLPKHLKEAVNDIFPNHRLEGGSPLSIGRARRSIEGNNPVVLLINTWSELHYVVGFGTKNRYNTYNLGLFKVRKVHTDSWVRVSDNGATTSKNNYLPYYMNTHAILGKDFVTYTLYRK